MAARGVPARPAWSSADDESVSLIVDLLRQDARQMASNSKGKQREGSLSDADLALQLYAEDLNQATIYYADRRMARSMQEAVQADTDALVRLEREERRAQNDRVIATALSAGRPLESATPPVNADPSEAGLQMVKELSAKLFTRTDDEGVCTDTLTASVERDGQPESSSRAASRKPHGRPCTACSDMKPFLELARAPCGHDYCRECLEHLFQDAMVDESLFPPRCCRQAIPVDTYRLYLNGDLVQKFKKKAVEFSTHNRTYCHVPTCSTFIPPEMIENGVAPCPQCRSQTCVTCKATSHGGDCPSDHGLQQVLEIAGQEGWRRCPKCCTMIALTTGCFHITCKCHAEFCYLCGALWKSCECVLWEARRLYIRAEEIYDRDHNPENDDLGDEDMDVAVVNPLPVRTRNRTARQLEIDRIMDHLRVNHECLHERWRSRQEGGLCEECGDSMPFFIYECRQCNIMACRRCKNNRL